jgi:hypothetical protein
MDVWYYQQEDAILTVNGKFISVPNVCAPSPCPCILACGTFGDPEAPFLMEFSSSGSSLSPIG